MERSAYVLGLENKGAAKNTRAHLREVLEARLDTPLPEDLLATIDTEQELATLNRCFSKSLHVTSLEEARRLLSNGH